MTRPMAIKWLKWIQNMFPEDSEQYKALTFAIDSLEVDEAYQLEYEKTTGAVEYDKETQKWFNMHRIDTQTTVCRCDKCGLYYKPSLGHKCKEQMMQRSRK